MSCGQAERTVPFGGFLFRPISAPSCSEVTSTWPCDENKWDDGVARSLLRGLTQRADRTVPGHLDFNSPSGLQEPRFCPAGYSCVEPPALHCVHGALSRSSRAPWTYPSLTLTDQDSNCRQPCIATARPRRRATVRSQSIYRHLILPFKIRDLPTESAGQF